MRKSEQLYEKAKGMIPGGVQLLSKRPEMFLPEHWPAYYSKAKGCHVWDLDNTEYIDCSFMGIGANVLGYADDDVNEAVKRAVDQSTMCTLNAPEEVELAELLLELHPWAKKVRYAKTGGEALAIAIRIARAKTRKDVILFCGYHGWTDWYLSANIGKTSALDGHLIKGLEPAGVPRGLCGTSIPFEYNDLESFRRLLKEYSGKIAAICMESIRNYMPEEGFFEEIQKEAKENNIILIIDEVSAGFRLCCGGAHKVLGIEPDIAVFAKAMSNGVPMAAIIGKSDVMECAQDTFISSTYWTERMGLVAAVATIKKYRDNHVEKHLEKIGKMVQDGWKEKAEKAGLSIHISGIYPMGHFEVLEVDALVAKTFYTQEMLKQGFLATNAFYASFAHNEDDIEKYLNATEKVFNKMKELINQGSLEQALEGPVCQSGFQRLT